MSTGRLSIAQLMLVIAIIAINIVAARSIIPDHIDVLIGVGLMWLAYQIALLRLIEGREPSRAFWAGFLGFGLLATSTYVWTMMVPRRVWITPGGGVVETPGSPPYPIWSSYLELGEKVIRALSGGTLPREPGGLVLALALGVGLVWISLPQGLLALLGAALGHKAFGRRGKSGSEPGMAALQADAPPKPSEISPTSIASPLRPRSR